MPMPAGNWALISFDVQFVELNDNGSHPRMRLHKQQHSSSSCSMIDFPTIELETCTNFDKGLVLFASFCAILVAIKQIKNYIDSKDKIAEKED